jgi:hypothetical protein
MVFSVDQSVTTGLVVVAGFGLLFIGFALLCPSKGLGFPALGNESLRK